MHGFDGEHFLRTDLIVQRQNIYTTHLFQSSASFQNNTLSKLLIFNNNLQLQTLFPTKAFDPSLLIVRSDFYPKMPNFPKATHAFCLLKPILFEIVEGRQLVLLNVSEKV